MLDYCLPPPLIRHCPSDGNPFFQEAPWNVSPTSRVVNSLVSLTWEVAAEHFGFKERGKGQENVEIPMRAAGLRTCVALW